jgi:hypothetical protein
MQQQQAGSAKKKYEKPEAKRFPLRPDEAVLGFCKTNAASGPISIGCRGSNACSAPGS